MKRKLVSALIAATMVMGSFSCVHAEEAETEAATEAVTEATTEAADEGAAAAELDLDGSYTIGYAPATLNNAFWLAVKDGTLVLEQTANQDTPLSLGMIPILPLDVWEHAYYLKHQNRRADYLEQYMSAVDWGIVGERIEEVVKW